jgi:hypothetical protein
MEVAQVAPETQLASPSINENKLQLYSIKPDTNNNAKYYAFFKIGETNNFAKLYLANTDYSFISNGMGEKMCFLTLNNETPYRIKIIAENAIKLVKIINQNYISENMENTIESYRKMSDSERTKIIESNKISITALQKKYYESFSINVEVMDEGVNSNRAGGASKSRKSRRTRKSRKASKKSKKSKKSGRKSHRRSRR